MIRRFFATAKTLPKTVSNRDAIKIGMSEEMRRDKRVFLIGEEVGQFHGAYKVSKGMLEEFGPQRVIDTPISEIGFTGIGSGASFKGLIPIVEFMTWNFALQAWDHIFNSSAKSRYMSGGTLGGGIVFRGLNGPGASVGAQHSQCFASALANVPGLIVISPYDAYDFKFLMKAAIRCGNPVAYLENELTYGTTHEVREDFFDENRVDPIGKARIMREGRHVTITAFSRMVGLALKAAEELSKDGIEVEVINLRTIKPLDRTAIIKSVQKTSRLVTIEDGYPFAGVGAEITATIMESPAFHFLDAPVERLTGWDIPLPYGDPIEAMSLPQVKNIVQAVRKVTRGAKLT